MQEDDLLALRTAVETLEHPGLAARLAQIAGKPIELVGRVLPETASRAVVAATAKALDAALSVAFRTMKNEPKAASSVLHKALAATSGAVGGSLGIAALPIELPISTIIILRSIGDVARNEGEDLTDPETALNCLQVFALGGLKGGSDAANSSYFAVRGLLAKSVAEAARFVVDRGVLEEGAPVLVRLIAQIASRFGVVVTQKLAAQAVPLVGALGGAAVNYAFINHFQEVARAHFVVRRLERRYGKDIVRAAYERFFRPVICGCLNIGSLSSTSFTRSPSLIPVLVAAFVWPTLLDKSERSPSLYSPPHDLTVGVATWPDTVNDHGSLVKYILAAVGGATALALLLYFADQGVLATAARYSADEAQLIKFMDDMGYPKIGEWCGEFAASIIKRAGGTPPSGAAIASNWRQYGTPDAMPRIGDVAVADRGVPTGATGSHVGFVTGIDLRNGTFTLESGNSCNIYTKREISGFSFHTPPNNVLSALTGNGVYLELQSVRHPPACYSVARSVRVNSSGWGYFPGRCTLERRPPWPVLAAGLTLPHAIKHSNGGTSP